MMKLRCKLGLHKWYSRTIHWIDKDTKRLINMTRLLDKCEYCNRERI